MEARAATPGSGGGAEGHLHQLLALALALTRAATAAAATTTASDAGNESPNFSVDPCSGPGGKVRGRVAAPLGMELGSFSEARVVEWAQCVEHLARFLQALQVQVAGELAQRVRAGRFEESGVAVPAELFATALQLSRAEAGRRQRLADLFLPITDLLTGVVTAPNHPILGSALFAGDVSAEQALVVSAFCAEATHLAEAGRIDPGQASELEETLTGQAEAMDPDGLRRLGTRALNHLDPDGRQPSDGELLAKQGIFFRQPRRGLIHYDGYMTIPQYETLMAGAGYATSPKHHGDVTSIDVNNSDSLAGADDDVDTVGGSRKGIDGNGHGSPSGNSGGIDGNSPFGDARGGCGTPGPAVVLPGQADVFDFLRPATDNPPTSREPGHLDTEVTRQELDCPQSPNPPQAPRCMAVTDVPNGDVSGAAAGDGPDYADEGSHCGDEGAVDPGGSANGWPPPQGPVPDWAQAPMARTWIGGPVGELSATTLLPGSGNNDRAVGTGPNADGRMHTGTAPGGGAPWPRWVNGIRVPEPGSGEELEGLDPIGPQNTDPAVADRRTHAQRLLDGIIECVLLAARTGKLPHNGGLKTQLFISTTQADLERRNKAGECAGIAFLPYSGPQPLAPLGEAICDADVTTLILGDGQKILNVGRTQRLFTFAQRKILTARDIGCCFPGCTRSAYWTEAHHIVPWQDGGETSINNGCLLCIRHHHIVHQTDWTIRLVDGVPLFTPPYSNDPSRRERRNTYHHGLVAN